MASKRPIDRESRNKMAKLLQDLLDGRTSIDDLEGHFVSWASDDAVIWGAIAEIDRLGRLLKGNDCGNWQECTDSCSACHKLDPKSEAAKRSRAKRSIARAIEFLRTGYEYRWDDDLRIPWWMVLPAAALFILGIGFAIALAFPLSELFTGIGIKLDESTCVLITCVTFALVWLGSFSWLANKAFGKDRRYWPFHGPKEWTEYQKRIDL